MSTTQTRIRQGLPRTPGGGPWPPADSATAAPEKTVTEQPREVKVVEKQELRQGLPRVSGGEPWPPIIAVTEPVVEDKAPAVTHDVALRRGLPRVAGGPPWPEVETAQVEQAMPEPEPQQATPEPVLPQPEPEPEEAKTNRLPYILGALGLIALAALAVFGARWFLASDAGTSFTEQYDGHAPMPESAPIGVPAWLAWSHFFNAFLMVLIIRSGLQIRNERRPAAYYSPRNGKGGKISLTIWFHQALDLLWVVNGAVFFIMLFVSGQWMRIVPTSWEVFPNALSAGIQYLSLDWPTENGWVHYNGLQQITYFVTVFIAAPLAIITGIRMSSLWPKNNQRLNSLYPAEVARAVHFPVMIYFVFFIITHVLLVFATGALRNLNHMFAAQGSVDPNEYAGDWTGFIMFTLAVAVTALAWWAARPMLISMVARVFGNVTAR